MNFRSQLRAIAQESFNERQDVYMLASAFIISLLAGLVIRDGMFYDYDHTKVGFFIVVCCALWMGMFDSILCICGKRDVLERDKFSGLKPVPYLLACVVYQAFHSILQSAVMCIVTALFVRWPSNTATLIVSPSFAYFFTVFLITFAAQMLGLAVSSLLRTSEKALTFAPFLLIYELVMSETIFGLPDALEPLRDTTIVRWGLNALGSAYDIDSLTWTAETKIHQMMSSFVDTVSSWLAPFGIDPATVGSFIASYQVDSSIMGVNHDLPEYAATAGHLGDMWIGLAALCLVGIVIAIAGFMRRIDMR